MSDTLTGGPAFPAGNEANMNGTMGMTLRDYFAGQALCGISSDVTATDHMKHEAMAKWAYKQADAMLDERDE